MKYLHYDLSIFIKCEGCGENLAAKKRYHADIMTQQLSYISAAGDMLTFHFGDGHTEKRQYIKGKRKYIRRTQ